MSKSLILLLRRHKGKYYGEIAVVALLKKYSLAIVLFHYNTDTCSDATQWLVAPVV